MSFFVAKNETVMEQVMDPDLLMKVAPDYYGPKFQALADLRSIDDGSLHKGSEFRRVASFVNVPLFGMTQHLFDQEILKDKKAFYRLIDHPSMKRYCTYDRRWQGGEQPRQGTPKIMNLAEMGLDYEGAPKSIAEFEPVYLDNAEATA